MQIQQQSLKEGGKPAKRLAMRSLSEEKICSQMAEGGACFMSVTEISQRNILSVCNLCFYMGVSMNIHRENLVLCLEYSNI